MGIFFSQEGSAERHFNSEADRNGSLLASAAEIVAQQRDAEQEEQNGRGLNSPARSSEHMYQSISVDQLLRRLLREGRIGLRRNLNGNTGSMWPDNENVGSDSESDEELSDAPAGSQENSNQPTTTLPSLNPQLRKSLDLLKEEIAYYSGARHQAISLQRLISAREMCSFNRLHDHAWTSYHRPYCFVSSQRASITNTFLPNRRKIIDRLRTKTFCCHYLPGGNGLLTASQDEVVRRYIPEGSRQRYILKESLQTPYVGWSILDLAVSPNGEHFVYCTWSEKLYQCKIESDESISDRWVALSQNQDSDYGRFALFSLRFSYDGNEIVSGGSDGHLYVYDRTQQISVLCIPAHEDDLNAVCFGDTSSQLIFSAGDDGLCKAWDRRSLGQDHRPVGVFAGHRDGITFIDSKGDDRYLLTNCKDQSIKIWDVRCFSSADAQNETRNAVRRQKWDYRYQTAPSRFRSNAPLKDDGSVQTLQGHVVLHTLVRAHFSPARTGNRYVYSGCARGHCVVYDVLTGKIVRRLEGHQATVRDCAWHPSDNEIVTTSWDGMTAQWRYDERVERNIHPESSDDQPGNEESSDEFYNPIRPKRYNVKRKSTKMSRLKFKSARVQSS